MIYRNYCASRKAVGFGRHRNEAGAHFRKVGSGLVAAVDDSEKGWIQKSCIFGIETDETGKPGIYSYWLEGEAATRFAAMSYKAVRRRIESGRIVRENPEDSIIAQKLYEARTRTDRRFGDDYLVVVMEASDRYDSLALPTVAEFFKEYGIDCEETEAGIAAVHDTLKDVQLAGNDLLM